MRCLISPNSRLWFHIQQYDTYPHYQMASLEFLPQTIHFSTGESFVRLESITDFRQCHGTIPYESRILYRCRRLAPQTPTPATSATDIKDEEQGSYILKVKIQIPDPTTASNSNSNSNSTHASPPPPGPSSTTTHETHALQLFREAQSPAGPNLIASENFPQPPNGLLPGGYISCTIMTRIPGRSLYELGYWSLAAEQREEIQQRFVETLK